MYVGRLREASRRRFKVKEKLRFNFWRDLSDEVEKRLKDLKYSIPSNWNLSGGETKSLSDRMRAEKLFKHFCSIALRRIPVINYEVHFSDLIRCDREKTELCEFFRSAFVNGVDVNHLISNKAKLVAQFKQENLDHMRSEWGIYHLHFDANRTADLLFLYIRGSDAYFLDVLPHGQDSDDIDLWCNKHLVETIHSNWPGIIKRFVFAGLIGNDPAYESPVARKNARAKNANLWVRVSDGTVYMPLGGGFAADGSNLHVIRCVDQMLSKIEEAELDVKAGYVNIRKQLNLLDSEDLKLKLLFDENMEPYIYNKKRKAKINICRL